MAEFHQADRKRTRSRKIRSRFRYGANGGPQQQERFASWSHLRRWSHRQRWYALLHQFSGVALHSGGEIEGRRLRPIPAALRKEEIKPIEALLQSEAPKTKRLLTSEIPDARENKSQITNPRHQGNHNLQNLKFSKAP